MSRVAVLRRIARLYGLVEEMHSLALRQATSNVNEAEGAIRAERNTGMGSVAASRAALIAGEREDWLLAQAEGEISAVRTGLLEQVKTQRIAVESEARVAFLTSRIKTEQMKQVVAQQVEHAALEEGRRTQAASDDRYAARAAWLAGRRPR